MDHTRPDELAIDFGRPVIARLYSLEGTEIKECNFYLGIDKTPNLQVERLTFKLGETPPFCKEQFDLKMLRFAASPYLIIRQHSVERHIRKRAGGQFEHIDKGAGVILLRRAETVSQGYKDSNQNIEVNWTCQWWVSGFWRNQYYATTKTHKPIWIAPFIKGPSGKPMKNPVRLMVR